MRALVAILLISSATTSTVVAAEQPPKATQSQQANELKRALQGMMQSQQEPPGQSKRPVDPDQGDDNAGDRAIQIVCSKDTPAAERSAICPVPISPE